MRKSGTTLSVRDDQGVFVAVGMVEILKASDAWAAFAEDLARINCEAYEHGKRSRPWLRQKKGRGAQ